MFYKNCSLAPKRQLNNLSKIIITSKIHILFLKTKRPVKMQPIDQDPDSEYCPQPVGLLRRFYAKNTEK